MNSRPLIPVKRCKVSESCCHEAMSRWCRSVKILAELYVVPMQAAPAIHLMCIIIAHIGTCLLTVGLCKFKLDLPFPIAHTQLSIPYGK